VPWSGERVTENCSPAAYRYWIQYATTELIAELEDNFTRFYEAFGKNLKLNTDEDAQNRNNLCGVKYRDCQ
jgi:HSP90 family molecular chaperone